jgi:hypothetical protein
MSKVSETNKKRISLITDEKIPELALIIWRLENQCTCLPDSYQLKSVDYYLGLLDGLYTQLEDLLFDVNAYSGWQTKRQLVPSHFTNGEIQHYEYRSYNRNKKVQLY